MSEKELELVRRKAGELYALMTRLPEFRTAKFHMNRKQGDAAKWRKLIKALEEMIDE